MFNKIYQIIMHWCMDTLPKTDDCHIKCATCGWESEHLSDLKFIYLGDNIMEGLCPSCYNGNMYYKRDYGDLKANPIPLTFKVYFKDDEVSFLNKEK